MSESDVRSQRARVLQDRMAPLRARRDRGEFTEADLAALLDAGSELIELLCDEIEDLRPDAALWKQVVHMVEVYIQNATNPTH